MIDWHRVFLPNHWVRVGKKNMEWDAILNEGLDKHGVRLCNISHHVVWVGKQEVWISNWPYSYGAPWPRVDLWGGEKKPLPTVKTTIRLKKMVDKIKQKPNTSYDFTKERERMK